MPPILVKSLQTDIVAVSCHSYFSKIPPKHQFFIKMLELEFFTGSNARDAQANQWY